MASEKQHRWAGFGPCSPAGCSACCAEGWMSSSQGGALSSSSEVWLGMGGVLAAVGALEAFKKKGTFYKLRLLLFPRWCETVYFIRSLFKSFNYHISCSHSLYCKGTIVWLGWKIASCQFPCTNSPERSLPQIHIQKRAEWAWDVETKRALTQGLF